MRGIRLLALAVAAVAVIGGPTAAHADDLGQPDIEQSYNDGEQGFIDLAYGLGAAAGARALNADCNFVLLPAVNSSTVQVLVEAHATAQSNNPDVSPAATGVVCDIVTPLETKSVMAARPGAVAVATSIVTIRLAAITLCSTPSVLWSDTVYQVASAPRCKAS
jgi:hypothetical protein